jgi:SAM-dependent methyltransferase
LLLTVGAATSRLFGDNMGTTKCKLCGGHTKLLHSAGDYRRPEDQRVWKLLWCAGCEFGQIYHPNLNAEVVSDFYGIEFYTHGGASDRRDLEIPLSQKIMTRLAWSADAGVDIKIGELGIDTSKSPRVCDIGCGRGWLLREFISAGYVGVGVEPDDVARELANQVCPVYPGTAEQLPDDIRRGEFDVVVMTHSLEHCLDPSVGIKNVASLLSETGTLVIEVPNNACRGFDVYGPSWPWSDIPRHLNFFTPTSLEKILRDNGLKITRKFFAGFTRQFSSVWANDQRRIANAIGASLPLNGETRRWYELAVSLFLAPERKYDSIRVHAKRLTSG